MTKVQLVNFIANLILLFSVIFGVVVIIVFGIAISNDPTPHTERALSFCLHAVPWVLAGLLTSHSMENLKDS